MPVICLKCSHVRPADAAPGWQCPGCAAREARAAAHCARQDRRPPLHSPAPVRKTRFGWLLLALIVLAGGWALNRHIEGRYTTLPADARAAERRADMERGVATLDAALQESRVDAGLLAQLSGRLEHSCARNRYGLSEHACKALLREREDACAAATARRFPGQIGNTERLQELTVAYVGCIFEGQ